MKRSFFHILFICFFYIPLVSAVNIKDSVHVRMADMIYFSSDFVFLQNALGLRICSLGKLPDPLKNVQEYFGKAGETISFSENDLRLGKMHESKKTVGPLILMFKLIHLLVDQQVSSAASTPAEPGANCPLPTDKSRDKVLQYYRKLVYLEDLLARKGQDDQTNSRNKTSIMNVIETLDKQLKHEIMADLP